MVVCYEKKIDLIFVNFVELKQYVWFGNNISFAMEYFKNYPRICYNICI